MGQRGPKGAAGAVGAAGTPGSITSADRVELLGVVESQIEDIYRELDDQIKRMAQLQKQMDDVREKLRQLMPRST